MPAPGPKSATKASGAATEGGFWRGAAARIFSIDPRALAVFRIGMGVLLLSDLAIRARHLREMYTDAGMFPRSEICDHVRTVWNWSFHLGGGSTGFEALLFLMAAGFALALLVGFETRLATIGSWVMLLSLHHRAPPILSGADILFRMLLFWGMFLPLGRLGSVDAWRERGRGGALGGGGEARAREPVFCVASAALLLQMPAMYFFSAIFKSNPVWFSGQVLAGALTHDFYVSPMGVQFLKFPRLLTGLTWWTLVIEWLAPILMFVPKWTGRLRLVCVANLMALHLGILVCLEVDFFSPVALTGLLLHLPSGFWDRLPGFRPREERAAPAGLPNPGNVWTFTDTWTRAGLAAQGLCLVFLIHVAAVNIAGLPGRPLGTFAPDEWKPLNVGLGLGQKWNMFEVVPSRSGWYVARAKLRDGSEVDLLRQGNPVDWERPAFPAHIYPTHRWRKLFREMAYNDEIGFQVFREPVARFLCRDWNDRHAGDRQIAEFDLVYCMERPVDGAAAAKVKIAVRERLVSLDLASAALTADPTAL